MKPYLLCVLLLLCLSFPLPKTSAWSNGNYSDDPSNPLYGTHDWIAEHALDWLPAEEKEYILTNLATYLYGTELPDNPYPEDGIGDVNRHHIYFSSDGIPVDDSAAVRAQEEYHRALNYLLSNDLEKAAMSAGIMSHYIADMAVFGHVMGSSTEWGAEAHHSDYETYVNARTSSYIDDFNIYLSFDGNLDSLRAYDAALRLAFDTTFDAGGNLTCVWMDKNYNWSNTVFRERCGESINLAVNYIADVLHTLWVESRENSSIISVVINEVELNPPGDDFSQSMVEWVELYNPAGMDVDIGGWKLSTTRGAAVIITIPEGTKIPADGYYVYSHGSQWLDNSDESIVLLDSYGVEIDRIPLMSDDCNDERTWQRCPDGQDFWTFRLSTEGSPNCGESLPDPPDAWPPPSSSSITCSVSGTVLFAGDELTVSGSILPALAGMEIILFYKRPDGSALNRTVTTSSDGSFRDVFIPDSEGSWSVKAIWSGDLIHDGATSQSVSFTVKEKFFIATPSIIALITLVIIAAAVIAAITIIILRRRKGQSQPSKSL